MGAGELDPQGSQGEAGEKTWGPLLLVPGKPHKGGRCLWRRVPGSQQCSAIKLLQRNCPWRGRCQPPYFCHPYEEAGFLIFTIGI